MHKSSYYVNLNLYKRRAKNLGKLEIERDFAEM